MSSCWWFVCAVLVAAGILGLMFLGALIMDKNTPEGQGFALLLIGLLVGMMIFGLGFWAGGA